jgi:hypothetical protein
MYVKQNSDCAGVLQHGGGVFSSAPSYVQWQITALSCPMTLLGDCTASIILFAFRELLYVDCLASWLHGAACNPSSAAVQQVYVVLVESVVQQKNKEVLRMSSEVVVGC